MTTKLDDLYILSIHRDNLMKTKTFEEYRDAHVAYVEMLIKKMESKITEETAIKHWLNLTDIKDKKENENG